jgi:hypothetical protein
VAGIPANHFVNAVREDPARRGLLYAATEEGVSVSFDDGDHWQSLQLGLPVTSVRDLVVHDDDLVIATHGRGFWILDGVGPLRQASPEVAAARAWLYQPEQTMRLRPAQFTGTPMPKDEPMAPNPPAGVQIDYVLGVAAAQPVTLEIRDASGRIVQHWSSADTTAAPDPAQMRTAPQWITPPQQLAATAGMHRFVWSPRYAAQAAAGGGGRRGNEGVWAPPGDYAVTLTVAGRALSRTLRLAPDPRVKLEPAAYREQFELARRIELVSARLAKATDAAGKIQKEVTARRVDARGPVLAMLDAFQARLSELSGSEPSTNPANAFAFPPKHIESLRWLSGALGNLREAVDGADAAPTPDARDGLAKLSPMVDSTLVAWERFASADLQTLNAKLVAADIKPIVVGP